MTWTLNREFETPNGAVRWDVFGTGEPIVLVHGTPYSSLLWRDIATALAQHRRVFVFDHLGFGQSDKHEHQDLSLPAHARRFRQLLDHWEVSAPSVVAHDIGGAVALRTLLLEGATYRDLTLVDAVSGGAWERGLFQLIVEHAPVLQQLPDYAHEALVASHMRHATHIGYRPGLLDAFLEPWRGTAGQAAFYRQYSQLRQAHTAEYEHLLGDISVPTRIIWGSDDRILPAPYGEWLVNQIPHAELHWIQGAGHVLQEDAPAQLLTHLTADYGARRADR